MNPHDEDMQARYCVPIAFLQNRMEIVVARKPRTPGRQKSRIIWVVPSRTLGVSSVSRMSWHIRGKPREGIMAQSIECNLTENALDYLILAGEQAKEKTRRMTKHALAT